METFWTTKEKNYWLTDMDIEEAMVLVRKTFPQYGSLQDSLLGATWDFEKVKNYPLILKHSNV